ncbi:HlyD family type I secretion periplasmic adaptor subunit [Comamonas sp. NoAH]|uniref:HlyD family type I secretion periplasmic adaptor subunit n=1 Tax=Comamonas halotolerans TaxID=3041496 RepID=UPI0024E08879|nr:HlyD family type I secretion periplasmic adaptor subunit [Comamonas sp. NoAH]
MAKHDKKSAGGRLEPMLSADSHSVQPAAASTGTGATPSSSPPLQQVHKKLSTSEAKGNAVTGAPVMRKGGAAIPKPAPLPVNSPSNRVKTHPAFLVVWTIALMLGCFIAWAAIFELAEVSTGSGKVVPSSHEQVIQSLEGGILVEMLVKEGDIVQAGQVLAQLDRTKSEATVQESMVRLRAAQATSARLIAEVNGTALKFPDEVLEDAELVRSETALFNSRKASLSGTLSGLNQALSLVRKELALTEPLVQRGAASDVEVLRLRRQANDLETRITDTQSQYLVKAREDLAKANAEIESLRQVTRGRADSLTRLTLTSPVRGVVKDISVTTIGGVIPPNGKLMEIVPVDEKLLVEARISPRDVAFIHPGQAATVKITAYDYSIYGGLPAHVVMISPDTIQDDVKRDQYYYRVFIRTEADHLKRGEKTFPISPGMIATVDIHTGSKTILQYLIKPFNKAREALRER